MLSGGCQLGYIIPPKKVGALALRDLLSIYNEMAKSTGNKALVPLDKVPDVAIAGTGLGKDNGPKIKLVFEGAGDDGFDIRGKLRILGADVATIDKAFVKANSGLEIRANVTKFKAGPIVFPNGDAEIVVRLDRDKGTIPTPRVLIRSQGLSLFGSKQELDLALYLTQANLAAKAEFGDLFKFNFKAFAGFQNLSSLADLGDADFALGASLSSDPGQWIRTAGKKEVKTYFDTLTAGNAAALKALDDANKEVQKLDKDITSMRAKVKAERQPAINALKSAEAEVKRLQEEIVYFEKRRVDFQRQIKPCNQTYNICVLWKLRRSGCHKRFLGECVIPKYTQGCARNVDSPDLPARAWCEAQNTKPRSESAWALAKKQGAIAAKIAAVATLDGIRKSINKLPVDLDPRVAGLIAGKKIAQLSLEAAKQTVKGLDQLATLLTKGINALDAPDIFALETSSIRGNLTQAFKGKPVIIDLNYKVTGKRYKNRFSFTMGNQAENARRFGVLALGIAVHETIKAGKYLKVVPHKLLDKVQNLYLLEMNKLNEELKKATVANETVNIKFDTDPDDAQLTMLHAINEDQKALREQAEAEQKKLIEVQKNAEETLSQQRLVQLASLLVGNKWKQMPGTAIDIAAGGNGSVWMVATNKSVKKWTGSNWSTVAGIKGLRIDVGPYGHAWVVSTNNDIYRWNGKLWEQKPGQAIDIGVGADGTVWMVRAESGKSAGVQRWSWTDNSWRQDYAKDNVVNPRWVNYGSGPTKVGTPSLGRQPPITAIDVDNQGRAWIIHGGSIARWNPAMALNVQPWDRVPSIALDIGVGADGTPIASRFDDSDPQSDYSPLVWNEKTWSKMPGGASTITVDKNGDPWAVDAANNIWAWSAAATAPGAHITAKPWQPHGGGYGGPVVSKEGDIVTVTGMVKNGDYDIPLMTLPTGHRPPGRLTFNLDNHGKPVRMGVLPDGRIIWVAGGRDHKWLSLSGITFSTTKGKASPLKNGWKIHGGWAAPPTVTKFGDIVTIGGLVKGNNWGLVATLSAGMRPPQRLVFNVNNHTKSARVNVDANGNIAWETGGKDHGWLSLSGITFSVKPGKSLPLANGWVNYGGHVPATITRTGDMVTVTGLIRGGKWGLLGKLPTGYRPPARMISSLNNHDQSARVDVLVNGDIQWVGGGKNHGWISLSGISFKTNDAPVKPELWKPFGGGYGGPVVSKEGDIVTVTGMVKNGDYDIPLMTLPTGHRPPGRLTFNLDNHGKPVRMGVLPDGRIIWVAGGRDHKWLSLSGITFSTTKGKALPLKNGWKIHGGWAAPPTVTKFGDIVTIGGLIRGGKWGLLGKLPTGYRPPARMISSLNNHDQSARVDVLVNGDIQWVGGGKNHDWISLSGISFKTNDAPPAKNRVWLIGTNKTLGGYGIYRWNGSSWDTVPGGAVKVAVDHEGNGWVVTEVGAIVRIDRNTLRGTLMPGPVRDIGAGNDGSVWVIGTNKTPGGYGIYRWNGSSWDAVPGGAVAVAVDKGGNGWVVNDVGAIVKFDRNTLSMTVMPGRARDIGAGNDGSVWIIGTNKTPGGYGIYRWNGSSWGTVPGGAVAVAVDQGGNGWVVNDVGTIVKIDRNTLRGTVVQRLARDIGS